MTDSKDIKICIRLKNDFCFRQKDIENITYKYGIYFIDS